MDLQDRPVDRRRERGALQVVERRLQLSLVLRDHLLLRGEPALVDLEQRQRLVQVGLAGELLLRENLRA